MLISMPTGTSTILGVFQAIMALLFATGRTPPANKLLPREKFASEIFSFAQLFTLYCTAEGNLLNCAAPDQTKARSTGSELCA
jgi:hypothetical protein